MIAHGDEEVRLILLSRGESALSSSQKVTVKRECGSRRGDQVFALSDLRSPDIGRGKREKPNDWLGPQNGRCVCVCVCVQFLLHQYSRIDT